jgi:tetratricopeptide (TPR) repeat protein
VSIALLCLFLASGLVWSQELSETTYEGEVAPRLQNVGDHTHPITTQDEMAQKFFNQGLNLTYGFNHREAARAYREVARRDPEAAMAYWGHALVLGPNINMPMSADEEPKAYELVQKAMGLRNKVSQRERDYIEALAARYSGKAEDRAERDKAYAEAMRKLHEKYPDDLDAATLYAESLMDLRPWNYWTRDGQPYPETVEILETVESVLKRNPNHPGAIHYYIHAVELPKPYLAESGADRLRTLAPGAGHLVHMPSHIYRRVGRYADASESNVNAIAADEDYITQCRAQGIYPLAYYPHNIHFLWDSATMEGRKQVAVEAARKVGSRVTPEMLKEVPILRTFKVVPLFAYVRFGLWEEILQEPRPPAEQRYWTGIWHYARGTAFMATGQLEEAAAELESLRMMAADKSMAEVALFSPNNAASVLAIATEALSGELAAKRGYDEKAIAHLHRAVLLQDALVYIEPPDWHYPMRQSLGAVLLEAGRPDEAEVVYWEDLKRTPENGWSLFGLMKALEAQGKSEQAGVIEERFRKAWSRSDVALTASRF